MDDDAAPPRSKRRRRSPDEAREQALASARGILFASGPRAVTLTAVAQDIGVTHGALIHHFGSVAGLHSALMGALVEDLAAALVNAIAHMQSDESVPTSIVDVVFDAFADGGAGELAAWISVSNRYEHLEPVREAVIDLVEALDEKLRMATPTPPRHMSSALLFITLCAFGDAMIGGPLREILGRDRDSVRRLAANLLPKLLTST